MAAERDLNARLLAAVFLVLAGMLCGGPAAAADRPVIVASKIDSEGALLGALVVAALEGAGIPVEDRTNLGPTRVLRAALLAGEIDLYPEYTGNGAFFHDRPSDPAWRDGGAGYALVAKLDRERHDLVWLEPSRANNSWLIAVRRDLAGAHGLASMEDLARFLREGGRIRLAASAEFVESPAALPSFERTYGFAWPRSRIVILPGGNTSVTMRAAAERMSGIDAAMVYGTDGALAALDLVPLADPKGAQIVYRPGIVVRRAVLERHPALGPLLSKLFSGLTLDRLRELNAAIAVEGWPARQVARRHLAAGATK